MKAFARLSALAFSLGCLLPLPAHAATYSNGTATATMLVSLTVTASCTLTASPLAFGSTGLLTTAVTNSTTLSVTCSNTTPYNIGLSAGTTTGSTTTSRVLAGSGSSTATVAYQLTRDSAYATNWGNTQGTDTYAGTGTGSAQTVTIYGRVPTQTTPAPDAYQSTITATVYF